MKIKDLKRNQYFWYNPPGFEEPEKLKVWMGPYINPEGKWEVDATCGGDYGWIISEDEESYISEATFYD